MLRSIMMIKSILLLGLVVAAFADTESLWQQFKVSLLPFAFKGQIINNH